MTYVILVPLFLLLFNRITVAIRSQHILRLLQPVVETIETVFKFGPVSKLFLDGVSSLIDIRNKFVVIKSKGPKFLGVSFVA